MRWGHYCGREADPSPPTPSAHHMRVPDLPRTCAICKQPIDPFAAPAAPRKHSYTIAEMARALFLVGSGWSYRQASQRIRRENNVFRAGRNDDREFGLAADCVELFAPMPGRHFLPEQWPDEVVLDALPMASRAT